MLQTSFSELQTFRSTTLYKGKRGKNFEVGKKKISFDSLLVKQLMVDALRSENIAVNKHDKIAWKVLQINLAEFQRYNFLKSC